MNITRIKAPEFYVGGHTLNEYELRKLQVEIVQGLKPGNLVVRDEDGNTATITYSGNIVGSRLKGMDLSSDLIQELFRVALT